MVGDELAFLDRAAERGIRVGLPPLPTLPLPDEDEGVRGERLLWREIQFKDSTWTPILRSAASMSLSLMRAAWSGVIVMVRLCVTGPSSRSAISRNAATVCRPHSSVLATSAIETASASPGVRRCQR